MKETRDIRTIPRQGADRATARTDGAADSRYASFIALPALKETRAFRRRPFGRIAMYLIAAPAENTARRTYALIFSFAGRARTQTLRLERQFEGAALKVTLPRRRPSLPLPLYRQKADNACGADKRFADVMDSNDIALATAYGA